jgi:hypothetical protein
MGMRQEAQALQFGCRCDSALTMSSKLRLSPESTKATTKASADFPEERREKKSAGVRNIFTVRTAKVGNRNRKQRR